MLAAGAMVTAGRADNPGLEDSDQLHVGTGVICDTQDEATTFVKLMDKQDPDGALQAINRQAESPMACGMATVAFHTSKSLGEVRTDKGAFNIMEIEVIAGAVDGNWRMIPHRTQYTAVAVNGFDI
jgi:hypothetical protein